MEDKPKVALINRKAATRFVIGLFLIAIFVFGYQYFRTFGVDIGEINRADTVGWIAAVEVLDEGQQVVLVKPNGEIVRSPDYKAGATDRDLAWRPSGNHLFFISDREEAVNHVYRWAIGRGIERRTTGTLARGAPAFPPATATEPNAALLVVRQGMVFELNPVDGTETRLVPPPEQQRGTGDEQQADDPGAPELRFKSAKWTPDRNWIVGVRRTDTGEMLVMQSLKPDAEGRLPALVSIAAGQRVDFDVNPRNGQVVFTAQGFQFTEPRAIPPQFIKNGRVIKPWEHWIGIVDPNNPSMSVPPIAVSPDKKLAFGSPAVSPDGANLVVLVGDYEEGGLKVSQMVVMPAQAGGGQNRSVVLQGDVSQPSWAPDSNTIAYIQADAEGKRSVFTIGRDGSGERNVTAGKGDFREPRISPQQSGG